MEVIRRDDLSDLVDDASRIVVSIYMPLEAGADSRQNSVRLKNLLRVAEEKLLARGLRKPDVESMLAPAFEPLESGFDWGRLNRGLAVFINEDSARLRQLPAASPERCDVGPNFYVLPLVEALAEDLPFYVLAVSQNGVQLLYGTRNSLKEIAVPELPANRDAAVMLEDTEPARQAHISRPQVPGTRDLTYHGHGGASDAAKDEIEQYLRAIDRALAKFLRGKTDPLVFTGVDYLFPIYQQANNYRHLMPTPITGNPEQWSPDELRERAWPIVKQLIESHRAAARARYGNRISIDCTSDRLEDILIAAHAGAVETLFVDSRVERLGVFSPETSMVRIDSVPHADSDDLVNLAAVLVLRASGAVEPSDSPELPGGVAIAAILRYPFAVSSGTER
jgi:hypothetical protein